MRYISIIKMFKLRLRLQNRGEAMKQDETLPVNEYLVAKKEAYYGLAFIIVVVIISASLSFVLLYSGSRQRVFESIMISSILFISAFIVRPYWNRKKALETRYPALTGLSIRGVKVPSSYLTKRIIVFLAELLLLITTFSTQYRPVKQQEYINTPINMYEDSSSTTSSTENTASDTEEASESEKKKVHVPTLGDIEIDLGSTENSSQESSGESEGVTNE